LIWQRCPECGGRFWWDTRQRRRILNIALCVACEAYILYLHDSYLRSPEAVW